MKICSLQTVVISIAAIAISAFAMGTPPEGWPRGGAGDSDRILATPLLVDLDGIPDGRLEIVTASRNDKLTVYSHDGTVADGWPQTIGFGDGTIASTAVGDVDGDGDVEIVVCGDPTTGVSAAVKVFERGGGSPVSVSLYNVTNASGKATPCLVNCRRYSGTTLHNALEILVRDGDGQLHPVYKGSSSFQDYYYSDRYNESTYRSVPSGSTTLMDRKGSQPVTPSVSAWYGGANDTYIAAGSTDGKLYRWKATSYSGSSLSVSQLNAYTLTGSQVRCYGSPTLACLNANQTMDIVVGATNGKVYAWDDITTTNLSYLAGWPKETGEPIVASPAVADLDGVSTNGFEVVVGTEKGQVFAWHRDGTPVTGWPVQAGGGIFGSPVVAQLDQTPELEVVATALDGRVYVWSADGQPLDKWPKRLGTQIYSSPAVGDIHNSGRMSIVVAGYDGRIYVFDLAEKSLDVNAGWRQFRGGPHRQGVVE